MKISQIFASALIVAGTAIKGVTGQGSIGTYKDAKTGITFQTEVIPDGDPNSGFSRGGYTVGMVLPPNAATVDSHEYIGIVIGASTNATATGWSGFSHGGGMPGNLLLMAWPYQGRILTSFRYATGYVDPDLYTGNATLTQISSTINSTHFTLIYRCQWCLGLDLQGEPDTGHTSQGVLVLAWSQAFPAPLTPSNPNSDIVQHDNGMGIYGFPVAGAVNPSYSAWAALAAATSTVKSTSTSKPTSVTTTGNPTTTTSPPTSSSTISGVPVPTKAYDYIVVGAGAGGIPLADKLSESGKSVLLIEKGPASSGRWGGTMRPAWLDGTNLTRFDVPGLCNEIWVDSAGIACTDTDQMAGCVLGGGTAVNAALWWNPNPLDWDYNFPTGWKSSDMASASQRVFSRIPGTDHPSADGQLYLQQGYNVVGKGLLNSGWKNITANNVPDQKNHTFSHTPYMFSHGERGGPMATYLVTAHGRSNFDMWLNTSVKRVKRIGGHITGVEVEPFLPGGHYGTVNVTTTTGRVILSAGTFGSAKILMRSGIGPADQLAVVQASSDGPTMIEPHSWINLTVGYNLDDHVNTDTVISHPDVVFYDFYAAYNTPIPSDESAYLNKRDGILTQSAPNIGPMFWDEITGSDGIVRQLQWTARVEGSDGAPNGNTMTLSQYLGRGAVSRGRTTITPQLTMAVSTIPYLHNAQDIAAVIQGIENLQAALSNVPNLTWVFPAPGQSAADYVNNMVVATSNRRANHWIGSAKMGTDDSRIPGGTAVVDTNTKVYGTDNLFVVDASVFPGMMTTNPSALIVTVAEHASQLILNLPYPQAQGWYEQCGSVQWAGSFTCAAPYTCTYVNDWFWSCQ